MSDAVANNCMKIPPVMVLCVCICVPAIVCADHSEAAWLVWLGNGQAAEVWYAIYCSM